MIPDRADVPAGRERVDLDGLPGGLDGLGMLVIPGGAIAFGWFLLRR